MSASPDRLAARMLPGDLVAIFALALLLRLALIFTARGDPVFDIPMLDAEYAVDWARQIRAGAILGSPEGSAYFRTPLYAWLLAGAFLLPGDDLLGAWIVQALLGAGTAVLLADVARRRFGRPAGLATGVLAAVAWPLLLFGRVLLIAPLAVFLGAALLRLWDGAGPSSRAGRWFALGVVLGIGGLARPNFLVFAPFALALALVQFGSAGRWRRALWLLGGLVLVVAPISVRNRVVSGEWILLSYQAGLNLWIGNNPEADGMSARLPGFSSCRNEDVEAHLAREYARPVPPREQDAHYRRLTLEFFTREPAAAIGLLARKSYLFAQGYEIRNNRDLQALRERNFLLRAPTPDFGLVGSLALLGIVVSWRRRRELLHISGFALAMAIGVVLFFVCARYRLPAWPPLLVFAGAGVGSLLDRKISGSARALQATLLVVFVLLARVDFLDIRDPDPSQTHFQYGNVQARAGDEAAAEREFRTALGLSPSFAEARFHLGALLLKQGRIAESVRELQTAADAMPRSFRVLRSLAEALEHAGRFDEALAVREQTVELSAGAPNDVLTLANTLGANGSYREAWNLYRGLESRGMAGDPYFLLNAGQTALALKKYEAEGIDYLNRAAQHPETRVIAYEALARYFLSLRRTDEALKVLSEALLAVTGNASLHRLRAVARYATGDATGAVEDLETVLELEPGDSQSRRKLEEMRPKPAPANRK